MCTRQGGGRPCLGEPFTTLLLPVRSCCRKCSCALSRVCGRCPLEHACHRCFTWVGLRLSWPRRAPLTCVPPDQKSRRTAGPMEKPHLPSALGNQSELIEGDAAAWLMPPRSGLLYPLSSGHSSPTVTAPSKQTGSHIPPNEKPPSPVWFPPSTSPFSSASLHEGNNCSGEILPRVKHWALAPGVPLHYPLALYAEAARQWELEGERGGGLLEPPQGWEKTLHFPRILHTVSSQHVKQNTIQMCIFKEQLQLLIWNDTDVAGMK